MTDPILSDNAFQAARFGLDGLARRQEVIGRNLANVDTPGYLAQTVDFETSLRRAIDDKDTLSLQATHTGHLLPSGQAPGIQLGARQGGSLRADGNSVDLDVELNQMAETGIRYQALAQSVSKKLLLLRTIAMSSR